MEHIINSIPIQTIKSIRRKLDEASFCITIILPLRRTLVGLEHSAGGRIASVVMELYVIATGERKYSDFDLLFLLTDQAL